MPAGIGCASPGATIKAFARTSESTSPELALGLYFAALVIAALADNLWGAVPFLSLFAAGFLYTGIGAIRKGDTPLLGDS